MPLPSARIRRTVLPIQLAMVAILLACFAAATLFSAVAAPFGSRRRPLRISVFGVSYCAVELTTIARAGLVWLRQPRVGGLRIGSEEKWIAANEALLAWALGGLLGAARRCFGFVVALDGVPDQDAFQGRAGSLVLARHAGPGDSFALVHLLISKYRRRVRIVMKESLQLDPLLDLLLNRVGCCFLPRPGSGEEDRAQLIGRTALSLRPDETLLLFPEGANWTPKRRRRVISKLRERRRRDATRTAALMTNVLPPRFGGVLACLEARPDLDVVMVAHAGLDRITTIRRAWEALPLRTPMTVRVWPAAEPPDTAGGRKAWLITEWAVVDEWIDHHRARSPGVNSFDG